MIKLIGILLVAVGFGFRVNALVVVLGAGLATGLAAGGAARKLQAQRGPRVGAGRHAQPARRAPAQRPMRRSPPPASRRPTR